MQSLELEEEFTKTELLMIKLFKSHSRLYYCYDDEISDFTANMLHDFMELRNNIEELYGDSFPHTLKIKE